MKLHRRLLPGLIVPAVALLTIAASAPFPSSIPLPDDFAPEGIAVGTGSTFYTGSLWDGDIYRGDLRSGTGSIFIDEDDEQAAGLKVDERHHLLFVAGAFTGQGIVYDSRTGERVATYSFTPPGTSLINDVAVARDAAYFTDSFSPTIYRVPIAPDGTLGAAEAITVTGPASPVEEIGLNGIDVTPNGKTLIVANTGLGGVFTVDRETGASQQIDIPGGPLPPSLDGILLQGRTLWLVANFSNTVLEVQLAPDLSSGQVVNTITSELFRVPTTVAAHGNKLALVNARFDVGFPPPFGPGAPEGTDYDVVLVDQP